MIRLSAVALLLSLFASIFWVSVTSAAGPLMEPAASGDVNTLTELLEQGADPNPEGAFSPLFFAARGGHLDAVKLLLDYGADPNGLTQNGGALHIAARHGDVEILHLLLERGADPNLIGAEQNKTPLHDAAYNGSMEIVQLLLEYGADVTIRTDFRGHAMANHFAALKGHIEVAEFLEEQGAKPWPVKPIQPGELESADLELGASRARKCTPCHTFIPNKGGRRGPSLWNVVGRPKATISSFKFSPAMKAQTGTWTFEELNRYIADVYGRVPGTVNKYFGVERDRKMRIALIAYLRTQADNPVPLPGE
ncbi:ankyrin repeat domain-containing protein [Limibacillus halophilus]